MSIVRLSCALMIVLACVASLTLASESKKKGSHHSALEEHMEELADSYKALRRQARRQQFDAASLKNVRNIQIHALGAMHENLETQGKVSAKKQAKINLAYRKAMVHLIKTALDLEISLLEKRHSDAQKLVTQLGRIKEDGHEQFKVEED